MKQKYGIILLHLLIVVYGISTLWLYYNQSVADLSAEVIRFQSDLPLHISMIIEDGWFYSFTAYAYYALYYLGGHSTVGIALLLSICSVGSIYATERLISYIRKKDKKFEHLLLALSLNFVMPIFIDYIGEFRYVSYQSGSIWHNSTYIVMKLFAILSVLAYLQLEKKYREGLTWKQWLYYSLLVTTTTGIKPSFLLVFSPIVGIFLLYDLIHGVKFKQIFMFGSALLPSGLVILWQNMVLFGSDTGSGIEIQAWMTFSLHTAIPKLAVLCSVLFCTLIVLGTAKKLIRDRMYLFVVLMAILGFLQALCIVESGHRVVDGNFLWGYSVALFFLFTICACKWLEMENKGLHRLIKWGAGIVYLWHVSCGLYFYVELLAGESYWMR